MQKTKQPQQNFVFKTIFNIVCYDIGIVDRINLAVVFAVYLLQYAKLLYFVIATSKSNCFLLNVVNFFAFCCYFFPLVNCSLSIVVIFTFFEISLWVFIDLYAYFSLFSSPFISCRHMQHSVRVNIENYFDLWYAFWRGRYTIKMKTSYTGVFSNHFTFALQ